MMLLAFFLIGVIGGLTAALYGADAWTRFEQRRSWDADTGEALAITNEAANSDDEFDVWMRAHGATE